MRYWIYAEPASSTCMSPVFSILSDTAVLAQYWDYWCERMHEVGKSEQINKEDCILDWVAVHWAVEATPEALLRVIKDGQ